MMACDAADVQLFWYLGSVLYICVLGICALKDPK